MAGVVGAVQAVDDALEGLLRGHALRLGSDGPSAARAAGRYPPAGSKRLAAVGPGAAQARRPGRLPR
jgi:hypothetical protein